MDLLVDSDIFIALINENDSNHSQAKKIVNALSKRRSIRLYTNNFVVSEIATVLSYKISQSTAHQFLKDILKSDIVIFHVDERLQVMAYEKFLSIKRKDTSMVDCINMALLDHLNQRAILSFDKGYEKEGYSLLTKGSSR